MLVTQQVDTGEGSEQAVVIKRYTPIPVRKQKTYQLAPQQNDLCLNVLYRDTSGEEQPLAKVSAVSTYIVKEHLKIGTTVR